jgi:hypothetical protein
MAMPKIPAGIRKNGVNASANTKNEMSAKAFIGASFVPIL